MDYGPLLQHIVSRPPFFYMLRKVNIEMGTIVRTFVRQRDDFTPGMEITFFAELSYYKFAYCEQAQVMARKRNSLYLVCNTLRLPKRKRICNSLVIKLRNGLPTVPSVGGVLQLHFALRAHLPLCWSFYIHITRDPRYPRGYGRESVKRSPLYLDNPAAAASTASTASSSVAACATRCYRLSNL